MKVSKIRKNSEKDLEDILLTDARTLDFKELQLILDAPTQVCYDLFRCGNETVEDVRHLQQLLINSLLDDAYIGFTQSESHSHLTWYNDSEGDGWLSREQVLTLIQKALVAHELKYEVPKQSVYNATCTRMATRSAEFKRFSEADKEFKDLKVSLGYIVPRMIREMRERRDKVLANMREGNESKID